MSAFFACVMFSKSFQMFLCMLLRIINVRKFLKWPFLHSTVFERPKAISVSETVPIWDAMLLRRGSNFLKTNFVVSHVRIMWLWQFCNFLHILQTGLSARFALAARLGVKKFR